MSMSNGGSGSGASLVRQCVASLRLLLLSPDFGFGCATDRDLCELLSDGEILCSVLTELARDRMTLLGGGHVPCFYSVNSQLLAKKNVRFFLQQCRETFGFEERDLFAPDDLLELKCPERVVKTLHRLLTLDTRDGEPAREDGELANVVQELCHTEKQQFDMLVKLLVFRKELLGALSEWNAELLRVVFRHTEQLYSVHKEFLAKLTTLSSQGSLHFCQELGPAFAEICPRLEIYFQHFSHMPLAKERLDAELAKSPELKNQLRMLENVICAPNCFSNLYEGSFRQLFNYQLMFERLSKTAAKEAPEAQPSVNSALAALRRLLDRANVFKRQAEQTDATANVLGKIIGLPPNLARPSSVGLLLVDGSFTVRHAATAESKPECRNCCVCVLTTKYLLVAAKAAKKQPPSYWLSVPILSSLQMRRRDAASLEIVLANGGKLKLEVHKRRASLDKWLQFFDSAKAACFPDGWDAKGHKFELSTFPAGTDCAICKEFLIGSVLQGFVCGQCGCRAHPDCLRLVASSCGLRGSTVAMRFFHPGLDREGAEDLLKNRPVGSFLLRNRGDSAGAKVLTVRHAKPPAPVVHIALEESNGKILFRNPNNRAMICSYDSLDEMLAFYKHKNLSEHFSMVNAKLTTGIQPLP